MSTSGGYCKAYYLRQLRAFDQWPARAASVESAASEALGDDAIVYLHDSYVVTLGIYPDEDVLFRDVTDTWRTFCTKALEFALDAIDAEPVSATA